MTDALAQVLPPGYRIVDTPAGAASPDVPQLPPGYHIVAKPMEPPLSDRLFWALPAKAVASGISKVAGVVGGILEEGGRGHLTSPGELTAQEYIDLGSAATVAMGASPTPRGLGGRTTGQPSPKPLIYGRGPNWVDAGFPTAWQKPSFPPVTEAGQRLGVDIPRAATATGPLTTAATRVTGAVPFFGQPVRSAAATANAGIQTAANVERNALGHASLKRAGDVVEEGIRNFQFAPVQGPGLSGLSPLQQRGEDIYAPLRAAMDFDTASGELVQTRALAQKLTDEAAAKGLPPPSIVNMLLESTTRPGGLTFEGARGLRAKVREWKQNPTAKDAPDLDERTAARIEDALSDDLSSIVETAAGHNAVGVWKDADAAYKTKVVDVQEALRSVSTGGEPEGKIFSNLLGMASGGARADVDKLALVREAVGDKNWGEVLSTMIERWGFDEKGIFDPVQFAGKRGWGGVTPEARAVLFRTAEEVKHAQALDDLARMSEVSDRLNNLATPRAGGIISGVLGTAGLGAAVGVVTGLIDPKQAMTLAGALLGARGISSILAKPEGARRLAIWGNAYSAFLGRPSATTSAAVGNAARGLAAIAAQELGLDGKAQLYLGNYLQGAPIGQPLAPSQPGSVSASPYPNNPNLTNPRPTTPTPASSKPRA